MAWRPAPGTGTWWAVGIVGCTAMVAAIIWIAWFNAATVVTFTTVSYDVVDDQNVTVEFDVHKDPRRPAVCRLRAMASNFSTVGSIEVPIPPADASSTGHTVTIRTVARATTGAVRDCRYVDAP